jgi:preprotein translocase subunit SecE
MKVAQPAPRRNPLRNTRAAAQARLNGWRFFAEVWAELRKAEWPTRQQAIRLTAMVIAISLAVGVLLGVIDFLFNILGRLALSG